MQIKYIPKSFGSLSDEILRPQACCCHKINQKIKSANEIKMITSLISKMAEGRQESSTADSTASRTSDEAITNFLLEPDFDLSSLSEESSNEEDENNISIDSETKEEIILEEHQDIIDNADEETSELQMLLIRL